MILDNEDILIQKAREVVNIPDIAYNMFNDKLPDDDRHKCITMVFEYIKSHCNLSDLISYKINLDFSNIFYLDAENADVHLIAIYNIGKRLKFVFYTDYKPNYIKQLKCYGLTITQYDQIKSKLIKLFNLEKCDDISEISTRSITYISKYDFR